MEYRTNITPVNRNKMFYSEADFQFEIGLLQGYLEEDTNQTVIVYEVDRAKTSVNEVYQEAKKDTIRYKPPKEIPCLYEIADPTLDTFDKTSQTGTFQVSGNLTLYVMPSILEKYGCDITRGDYVAIQIDEHRLAYFTITDDGKVNSSNKNVVGAYKVAFRTVLGAASQDFSGK